MTVTAHPHFFDGKFQEGKGEVFQSFDPASGALVWEGSEATECEVEFALLSAQKAFLTWSHTPLSEREHRVKAFAFKLEEHRESLAQWISMEVGKPLWESRLEVQSMIGKVALSIEAYHQRCASFGSGNSITRFRPHGVAAVFGPYNFPGHLANGHIVPALLAGNTIVFKASEYAPAVAQKTVEIWRESGLPDGVLNLVQGGKKTGQLLSHHDGVDALFFTGSSSVGLQLLQSYNDHPGKIIALEMGGNNPLVVYQVSDLKAAAYLTIQSAYITAGQRCTCARRLILPKGEEGDYFLKLLEEGIDQIKVGVYSDTPEPFMGPVISERVVEQLLAQQQKLIDQGGKILREMRSLKKGSGFITPGLIDVTSVASREDREFFGPFLQVIRVENFDAAIEEANRTAYGLAAGLFSDGVENYEQFRNRVRAGVINWNQQLTGASGAAPFGGIGLSGNHRPSGYLASDYCSYPVASIELERMKMPAHPSPGFAWS
ncbi:MAG: succinylglutamate-semialdehyde dehydrogenase [Verrucomicrobiota bacterium]